MDEPKKMGRPLKLVPDEITLKTLSGLARIQCTTKEAAAVLMVSEVTFIDFLKRSKEAKRTWEDGKQTGFMSLRRLQFKAAENGNTGMMVWLGKQYLGQKDKNEVTHDASDAFVKIWEAVAAGAFHGVLEGETNVSRDESDVGRPN